jgi:hypothetical protein
VLRAHARTNVTTDARLLPELHDPPVTRQNPLRRVPKKVGKEGGPPRKKRDGPESHFFLDFLDFLSFLSFFDFFAMSPPISSGQSQSAFDTR